MPCLKGSLISPRAEISQFVNEISFFVCKECHESLKRLSSTPQKIW